MTSGKEEESREMEQPENQAAARNGQYAHTVLNRAADIIEGAAQAGRHWRLEDALKQAGREFRLERPAPEVPEPNYGVMPLLEDIAGCLRDAGREPMPRSTAPVESWAASTEPSEVAGVLREAAPEIARRAREWTLRVSPAMRKLAAMEITGGELSEIIRQARSG